MFVDYDNVASFFPNFSFSGRVSNWLTWLEDGHFDPQARKRRFVTKRVYWHRVFEAEQPAFEQFGFTTKTCVYHAGKKRGQSAVDLHLAIDVLDDVNTRREIKEVIILASDSDYVPLIDRLREKGLATCIMVSPRDVSEVFESKADLTIANSSLEKGLSYVRRRKSAGAVSNEDALPAATARGRGAHDRALRGAGKSDSRAATATSAVEETAVDFAAIVDAVAKLAKAQPGLPVGKGRILKVFERFPGFKRDGKLFWFGLGGYEQVLEKVISIDEALQLRRYQGGGIAILSPSEPKSKPKS